ncbi:hypothetical protein STTU_0615 [Streptomyces sp. Tu6071]|nr:hypothetical protein STTU_0615 [Streptomyces sp. Tu6071]
MTKGPRWAVGKERADRWPRETVAAPAAECQVRITRLADSVRLPDARGRYADPFPGKELEKKPLAVRPGKPRFVPRRHVPAMSPPAESSGPPVSLLFLPGPAPLTRIDHQV